MNVFIDIETVPSTHEAWEAMDTASTEKKIANLKAPGNYKKPESIQAWLVEEAAKLRLESEERLRKTSLEPTWGEIICCVMAVDDEPPVLLSRTMADEESMLLHTICEHLQNTVQPTTTPTQWEWPRFIGWHLFFDLSFLWSRMVVNDIKPPVYLPAPIVVKPMGDRTLDLMQYWAGWGNRVSLKKVCAAVRMPDAGDIDGDEVWNYVQAGEYNTVYEHCVQDVERVRELARRMGVA